jgi:predicted nucleotidyltransferase component of viral defense system
VTRSGPKRNVAASVRDRLMQLSRARKENFNFVLDRYAMERLLYRLSESRHHGTFVLKGAILFTVWSGHPHRSTKDIDLLGSGAPDLDQLTAIFRDICDVKVEDDGVEFDAASITAARIKEDADYEGVRLQLKGKLGTAVLNLQVDIGFGDAVTPPPVVVDFPVLLALPAPRLKVYPRETVVAEKLEAMVQLGIANSRMKDFFDLEFLARSFEFDGRVLTRAIHQTFNRRGTAVPEEDPVAFTKTFTEDPQKNAQWAGFVKRSGVVGFAMSLAEVVANIGTFLKEPLHAVRTGTPFGKSWSSGRWH